jgi:hypothetical protein
MIRHEHDQRIVVDPQPLQLRQEPGHVVVHEAHLPSYSWRTHGLWAAVTTRVPMRIAGAEPKL